jgi:tetratricopeptide (TPR) repeat protein
MISMPYQSPCCVSLNNEAVELFQKGDYLKAAKMFRRAVNSFIEIIPETMEEDIFKSDKSLHISVDKKLHSWSHTPVLGYTSPASETIFVHQRAAFLCPDSFRNELYCLYSAFILYNLALCYQQMSIMSKGADMDKVSKLFQCHDITAGALDGKAHRLYSMALAALQKSHYSDGVFLTVLLNNTAHLLYEQCMTYEATRCFRVVRELVNASDVKDLFESGDYCGLYLNSLISSDTASAA